MTETSTPNVNQTPTDFLVCGVIAPSILNVTVPFSMGVFELSRLVDPLPGCRDALDESASAFGEAVDLSAGFLVKVFLPNSADRATAVRSARLLFREALLLFRGTLPAPATLTLMRCGYALDLRTLVASPIRPPLRDAFPGTMFLLDDVELHPLSVVKRLLSVHGDRHGELGGAIRRSTHWSGLAEDLEDEGERFLVQWMACETLTRVHESEDLAPKLSTALGLPTGRYFRQLPEAEQHALQQRPEFKPWSRVFTRLFDNLRCARNNIAHTGYRELELVGSLGDQDFNLAKKALPMVIGGLQSLALAALALGKRRISEFWDNYAACERLLRPGTTVSERLLITLQRLEEA